MVKTERVSIVSSFLLFLVIGMILVGVIMVIVNLDKINDTINGVNDIKTLLGSLDDIIEKLDEIETIVNGL